MGKAFLAAGKHVLMEKPMTVDVPEARELAAAADRALCEHRLAFMVRPQDSTPRPLHRAY